MAALLDGLLIAQKAEHQCTKLKVTSSNPAEVHFTSGCFFALQTN